MYHCRLFKESPHPDEKQREQLSKQLGLAPRQVKFWFQNRRTQIKVTNQIACRPHVLWLLKNAANVTFCRQYKSVMKILC